MTAIAASAARPIRVRHALAASLTGSAAIQLMNIGTGLLLARGLGPQARGQLAVLVVWFSITTLIASLGVGDAVTVRLSRRDGSDATTIWSGLVIVLLESVVALAVMVTLGSLIWSSDLRQSAYIFLPYIPIGLVTTLVMGTLNGLGDTTWFQIVRVLEVVTALGGLAFLAGSDTLTIQTAVAVYVIGSGLTLAVAVWRIRNVRYARAQRSELGALFRFGIRAHSANMAPALNDALEPLLIGVVLGASDVGLFVVAASIASAPKLIGQSISLVALPAISRQSARQASVASRRFVGFGLLLSVLSSLPLIMIAPFLIKFLFGSAFAPATNLARILTLAAILSSTTRVAAAGAKGRGMPQHAGIAEAAAFAAKLAAFACLVPFFGLEGAGVAVAIGSAAGLVLLVAILSRSDGFERCHDCMDGAGTSPARVKLS